MFSQHTVQTNGTKKVYFFSVFSLHQLKKEKCLSSFLILHSFKKTKNKKQKKDEKPTKRRASPQKMCGRSKEPSVVFQSLESEES
jgi:hypothetical protein